MNKIRRIASHWLYTPTELIPRPLLTVGEDGTILNIESRDELDSVSGTEFYSGILVPGLVNAHCHLELSYMKGMIPSGVGFTGFAEGMGRHRGEVEPVDRIRAAEYWDSRMFADGVQAVADISNGETTFEIKRKSNICYHTFMEVFGAATQSADAARRSSTRAEAMGLKASVTPHSTYSLDTALFEDSVSGSGILSVHFMESDDESLLFRGRGPMHNWYARRGFRYDFLDKFYSPVERVVRQIPGDRKILLVHNTCVDREIIDRLKEHFGDNATWVLCPRSNRYISGARPPVDTLRAAGVRIAVGTDSLASNSSLSLIDELREFDSVPLTELLGWVTENGAHALGLDSLGRLRVGTRPGVVLITDIDTERMSLTAGSESKRIV